jgi:hypothetical protein
MAPELPNSDGAVRRVERLDGVEHRHLAHDDFDRTAAFRRTRGIYGMP